MIEMTADPLCHISLMGVLRRTDLGLDLDLDLDGGVQKAIRGVLQSDWLIRFLFTVILTRPIRFEI